MNNEAMNNDRKEINLTEMENCSGGDVLSVTKDGLESGFKTIGNAVCDAGKAAYKWFSGLFGR